MSVAETAIAQPCISWDELTNLAPLPKPRSLDTAWDYVAEDAGRAARKEIWITQSNSPDAIRSACTRALKKWDKEDTRDPLKGAMRWTYMLAAALADDPLVKQLPTLDGVDFVMCCIKAWWPEYWAQQDKSDIEDALSLSEVSIELQYDHLPNQADVTLARLLWLNELRKQFPGCPVTREELRRLKHRRRVLAAGEKYSANFSDLGKSCFVELLENFAEGSLDIPVSGNSLDEAVFLRGINFFGIKHVERCRIGAALLQTAAALNSETPSRPNAQIHSICGYAIVLGTRDAGNAGEFIGAAPGLWRLRIEGEQYIISCELWPRPVVMSHNEFGRARGSANAILRDVGISVDSPPGHWKKVWETYGLRNQLLAAAERVDPQLRLEQVWRWMQGIAAAAPAAHRPAIDGSAVRLADGATVADPRWLVERALEDGVILAHEQDGLEKEIRRRTRETNRRDAAQRQRKFIVLEADAGPAGNLLSSKGPSADRENDEER